MLNIAGYLDHLRDVARVSPTTLKNYRSTLGQFQTYLGERELSPGIIGEFLSKESKATTANVKSVRIAGLAKHLGYEFKTTRAKEPKKIVDALTSEEVHRLLKAIDPNYYAAARFLVETGLRFSEFLSLSSSSLESRDKVPGLLITGKGMKDRWVPLSGWSASAFHSSPWQMNDRAQEKFRHALTTAGLDAGLKPHIHPHLLRASFISILLNERKAEAIHVASLVGHSNLNTMLHHYYKPNPKLMWTLVNDGH